MRCLLQINGHVLDALDGAISNRPRRHHNSQTVTDYCSQDKHFGNDWSLQALISPGCTPMERAFNSLIENFSQQYKVDGLKDIYNETWDKDSYSFSPRRVPSCVELSRRRG